MDRMSIVATAFKHEGAIPKKHTCDGEDVSPALSWDPAPGRTQSLALIMDDPDAPMGTWIHWVLYNMPKDKKSLSEAIQPKSRFDDGSMHGNTDFRRPGYGGPCPPPGKPHRYYFKIYALDKKLNLSPGASKAEVEAAMEGHVLAKGELMGRYKR